MADTLRSAGFHGCLADPEPDGTECQECVLCHADNVLAMSHDPKSMMDCPNTAHTLKAESVKAPDECLGSQICKHTIKETQMLGPGVQISM